MGMFLQNAGCLLERGGRDTGWMSRRSIWRRRSALRQAFSDAPTRPFDVVFRRNRVDGRSAGGFTRGTTGEGSAEAGLQARHHAGEELEGLDTRQQGIEIIGVETVAEALSAGIRIKGGR